MQTRAGRRDWPRHYRRGQGRTSREADAQEPFRLMCGRAPALCGGYGRGRTNDLTINRLFRQPSRMPADKAPDLFCSGPLPASLTDALKTLLEQSSGRYRGPGFSCQPIRTPNLGKGPGFTAVILGAGHCHADFKTVFVCLSALFRQGAKLKIPGGLMRIMACGAKRLPGRRVRRPIGDVVA